MFKRSVVLLFLLVSVIFAENKAYSDAKPAENPMPEKLFIPAELLGINVPDKLPSENHDVDMPKPPDFKRTRSAEANKTPPELPESYKKQPFIWPVIGDISSGYGFRSRGIKGGTNSVIHEGIDVPLPKGTPIMAARGGVVKRADSALRGYGMLIDIDHGEGVWTRYAHCSEFAVKKGDTVSTGQIIAYVGNSGRSTSSHLHFEIIIDGEPYNPTQFLGGYHSAFVVRLTEDLFDSN